MIITNQGLSKREKILIIILVIILVFTAYTWYDMRNPDAKYQRNKVYCQADYDCVVVYDLISNHCFTVNNIHRYRYEQDTSCRGENAVCRDKQCILE